MGARGMRGDARGRGFREPTCAGVCGSTYAYKVGSACDYDAEAPAMPELGLLGFSYAKFQADGFGELDSFVVCGAECTRNNSDATPGSGTTLGMYVRGSGGAWGAGRGGRGARGVRVGCAVRRARAALLPDRGREGGLLGGG